MNEGHVQHTLRYFVRSYVTKPTTINAITDIPAKIPRPIGSTDIFFPGIWKAGWAVEDEEAVISAAEAADESLALDVDLEGVVVVDGEVCGDGVTAESGIEEIP